MKSARAFLIFCYGLFTIAAQTLLFREFITTFQGNDISVSLFFASWLFWIGIGAIFAYRPSKITGWLVKNIGILLLVYIPAFILELILIIQARQIAGVSSYTLLSIHQMILLSLLVNIPVSFITGLFFPLACRWVQQDSILPVSSVYIIEAAGSFLGGIGTTILLSLGVNSITIFFILAFAISLAAFMVRIKSQIKLILPSLILACILLGLTAGVDKRFNRYIQTVKWSKLLPAEAMSGSFQTAQAEYLYGTYHGQWVVVSQGSTCEALPDKESTSRITATVLSQKPDAKKILVIGSGLGVCYEFLLLPQIEQVTWTHCDSQYVQQVNNFLPAQFKNSNSRLLCPAGDIRGKLTEQKNSYDIVIINLPDATSSVLNRYFTVEFYEQLRKSMSASGIIAVRITGGENIMGTELIDLGASTKRSLEKVFSHLVLTPGDDMWFIASDSENLTGDPGILQDRFAKIKNAQAVLAPSALLSFYLPDRAADAIRGYNNSDLPQELLINSDSRPLASLYSLLLTSKQSGAPVTKIVKLLAMTGFFVFFIPVFIFVILRLFYIARTKNQNRISIFDSSFLVFSAGWLGIGSVIVLMYLYQTIFGSLYLYIGVISSLFMIGLTAGASLIRYLPGRLHQKLFMAIFVHAILLTAIIYLPVGFWTHQNFAAVFFLCGLCCGVYFPIAARQLADGGFETGFAGAKLEMADHIGASAGSLITGLALVPVFGAKGTILVFLALILANVPAALLQSFKKAASFAVDTQYFRKAGYSLFGIAACVIICSNVFTFKSAHFNLSLPQNIAQTLAGQSRIKPAESAASKIRYFKVYETKGISAFGETSPPSRLTGYIFNTQDLAPDVQGFGGKINLAVYIDSSGRLINFQIIRSNETPDYLAMLTDWFGTLKGHQLFRSHPLGDIDTATGATISATAVVSAIETAGKKFADEVLSKNISAPAAGKFSFLPDRRGFYLLTAIILSLWVIYKGNFWSRLAILVFNAAIGGFILNAQYSSEQVTALLSGQISTFSTSLLIIGVPFLILLFGNIYCGYLCPFGALQELFSYIIPEKLKQPADYKSMRKARFIKYIILFIMVMVFFFYRNKQTLVPDPLIAAFNFKIPHTSIIFAVVILAVIGSVFYRRFWCRYLCPVGAFLSLFNNLIIFKRFIPAKFFSQCEFGLTVKDNMDCIYCDRCRYWPTSSPPITKKYSRGILARYLLVLVLIFGIFLSVLYINKFLDAISSSVGHSTTFSPSTSAGQPRDVDIQKIRTMIEEKKLSNHPADFYEKKE